MYTLFSAFLFHIPTQVPSAFLAPSQESQPEPSVRSLYNNDKMALNHKIYMCPGI